MNPLFAGVFDPIKSRHGGIERFGGLTANRSRRRDTFAQRDHHQLPDVCRRLSRARWEWAASRDLARGPVTYRGANKHSVARSGAASIHSVLTFVSDQRRCFFPSLFPATRHRHPPSERDKPRFARSAHRVRLCVDDAYDLPMLREAEMFMPGVTADNLLPGLAIH